MVRTPEDLAQCLTLLYYRKDEWLQRVTLETTFGPVTTEVMAATLKQRARHFVPTRYNVTREALNIVHKIVGSDAA